LNHLPAFVDTPVRGQQNETRSIFLPEPNWIWTNFYLL